MAQALKSETVLWCLNVGMHSVRDHRCYRPPCIRAGYCVDAPGGDSTFKLDIV